MAIPQKSPPGRAPSSAAEMTMAVPGNSRADHGCSGKMGGLDAVAALHGLFRRLGSTAIVGFY